MRLKIKMIIRNLEGSIAFWALQVIKEPLPWDRVITILLISRTKNYQGIRTCLKSLRRLKRKVLPKAWRSCFLLRSSSFMKT
jgi:hypothetical protein